MATTKDIENEFEEEPVEDIDSGIEKIEPVDMAVEDIAIPLPPERADEINLDVPEVEISPDLPDDTVEQQDTTEGQTGVSPEGDHNEQMLAEARKQTEFLQKIAEKEGLA